VEGIFLSGLIASGFTVVTLLPVIVRHFGWDFSPSLFRALFAFGLPYIPAGLATMVVQVIDRPLMRFLTDDATVGIYQANYRLGIIMMLIVSMYDYAWRPFFLSHAKDPDAKSLFARALTYFVVVSSWIFLAISFFISDIVRIRFLGRHLIHPDYWGGLSIVPVVLLAYIFLGIYNNLIAGIYIENKTKRLPGITAAAAGVNILVNFLLIPRIGMMGGAVATLVAYIVMAAAMYVTVQGFYPVRYEWGRIMKVAVAVAATYFAFLLIPGAGDNLAVKFGLLFLFGLLIVLMKFFVPEEIRALRALMESRPAG
jgi:O-antigen/teichoic acid export membrane protein